MPFDVGDFVEWDSSGGTANGRITRIVRDGELPVPDSSFTLNGTEDNPAALIRLFRDGEATDTMVGHRFSELREADEPKASNETLEHKQLTVELEVKEIDGKRTFEGYASTFGNTDLGGDVIEKGAFQKTIRMAKKEGMPVVLWQHQMESPIGRLTEMKEDENGLMVKGMLVDTEKGEEAYKLMQAGVIDKMSIGYTASDFDIDSKRGIRRLKQIKLFEVSLVTFPMNPKAGVTGVKRDFEGYLREAGGYSRTEAKLMVSAAYGALRRHREGEGQKNDAELVKAIKELTQTLKGS